MTLSGVPSVKSRRSRQKQGELRKPYAVWVVTLFAFVLPGSGQMLNGNPIRGITMQFFMLFFGFVTYQATGPEISVIGRFAGGIAVYVISVLDANAIARRRTAAWARMEEEAQRKSKAKRRTENAQGAPAGASARTDRRSPSGKKGRPVDPTAARSPRRPAAAEGEGERRQQPSPTRRRAPDGRRPGTRAG